MLAGIFYVTAWEASQAITGGDFAAVWERTKPEQARHLPGAALISLSLIHAETRC